MRSSASRAGGPIPVQYTCEGEDISPEFLERCSSGNEVVCLDSSRPGCARKRRFYSLGDLRHGSGYKFDRREYAQTRESCRPRSKTRTTVAGFLWVALKRLKLPISAPFIPHASSPLNRPCPFQTPT